MLPTINIVGDYLVVSKLHSRGRECKVGDVISYVHPTRGPGDHIAKRVVGMPGDLVVMDPLMASGEIIQVGSALGLKVIRWVSDRTAP